MRVVKDEVRVLGVDDAPFQFSDKETLLVGTVFRGGSYIEAVLSETVTVDGLDVTDRIIAMVQESRQGEQVQVVMLDGITFAGFNVADIGNIAEAADVAVIAVSRDRPDRERMRSGMDHVDRVDEREELIDAAGTVKHHELPDGDVHFQHVGISEEQARTVIDLTTVRGRVPEPVRVAHLIGAGIKSGESKGGA